jgi:hypothetical protein
VEVLPFQVKITLESLETVSNLAIACLINLEVRFCRGQTLSEVNKRLNPLFFAAEPILKIISEE